MKRIIMVLAVAALMAVMIVAMAAPAFAKPGGVKPFKPPEGYCEHGQAPGHANGGPGGLCGSVVP